MKILVTGGAGFIGSNFIRYMLSTRPDCKIINLDKLTYAGNLANLKDVERNANYTLIKGDICDKVVVEKVVAGADGIINFAAETHVDRSITGPEDFVRTDILGTFTLLEAAKKFGVKKYVQISTDEVYGSTESGSFKETDPLKPSSPYSASKAGADMLALSYFTTYGLSVVVTRSSNNFGPYQYPEKLIPVLITKAMKGEPLPIYGDGKNVRDWLYVLDNCRAIDLAFQKGRDGEIYNIGGGHEKQNIEIAKMILKQLGKPESLLTFVKDRPGHDRRYSIDCSKLKALGWRPTADFDKTLRETVDWYVKNEWFWKNQT